MIAVLGMNKVPAVLPHQLLRLIAQNFSCRWARVEDLAVAIDQRNRIRAVLDQRSEAFKRRCHHSPLFSFSGSKLVSIRWSETNFAGVYQVSGRVCVLKCPRVVG